MTGIYVILAELKETQEIQAGKKKRLSFNKGFYGYVGSALASLEKRVARHTNPQKKLHWHIDYLLQKARVRTVIYAETAEKKECVIARALNQRLPSIKGFGCSDCNCHSHLFFCQDSGILKDSIVNSFKIAQLDPVQIDYQS